MSEIEDAVDVSGTTAGRILRKARQAQGVHIAALAAAIKVSQRKLEALEADRFDELPDPTFTRALAQTVCRSLKIDPNPVLALLPQHVHGRGLEHISEGTRQPFREHNQRLHPGDVAVWKAPAVWAPLLVILAAIGVWLSPAGWLSKFKVEHEASGAKPAQTTSTMVVPSVAAPLASQAAPADAAASGANTAEAPSRGASR